MAYQSRGRAGYGPVQALVRFDAAFYAARHPDLAGMGRLALLKHYVLNGRSEGRFASFAEAVAPAEAEHGKLPADFNVTFYRQANPDVARTIKDDRDLAIHYLRFGRAEDRRYARFDPVFYRALYRPDWELDAARLEQDWRTHEADARFASWTEMLEAYGFSYGPWVEKIEPAEFAALNESWAGEVRTQPQAALAFVREGWRRLAPLSLGLEFDPAFYRETHPELKDESDPDVYKAWLLDGVAEDEVGSPAAQLRRYGLRPDRYPEAFPWGAYVNAYRNAGGDRWTALEHLVEHGLPSQGLGPIDDDRRAFLRTLSDAYARRGDDASAILALNMVRQAGPLSFNARQHLGDAYVRTRRWKAALEEYEGVIQVGRSSLWTVLNAVTCAVRLNDFPHAFAMLAQGKARFEGEQLWLEKLDETLKAAFTAAAFEANKMYGQDRVVEGDRLVLAAVDQFVEQSQALAPHGAPVAARPYGRVVILANQDLRQCTHYRVEQKAELFEALGRPYEIFDPSEVQEFIEALPGASAAIFYRLVAFPEVIKAILTARSLGIATYYEIDDLVFDSRVYPAPIETYGGQVSQEVYDGLRYGAPLTRAAMALCDYGIASTRALSDQIAPVVRTGRCFVIRNGLDSGNEDYLQTPPAPARTDQVAIFYGSGTLAHNTDFLELAGPALIELMREDERVRLVIVGYLVLDAAFDPFLDRIERVAFLPNARAYWSLLAKADINLAVLEPGIISDCKSEIKWLEAAVFAVPSIVSSTATYRDVLEDGRDVLMADDRQGWRDALRRLVADAGLREQIGAEARRKAAALYSLDVGAQSLKAALAPADQALQQAERRPPKPRVMIVNVYFPPQTIGGATRVVRDNIDRWIASGVANEIDFAVVSTDHEARPPYVSRVDSYKGLPVFRVSTPMQSNMDWRPLDRKVGAAFKAFIEAWKPDLVHFHAVQRLTASCLEVCQQAGVPYLVTVHDAWWLSDWPFLVDENGHLQRPGATLLEPTSTGVTPAHSKLRLKRLADNLKQAQAVLAVSQSFADLYRDAGVENVVAVPNGLPSFERRPRRPSTTGRVRLGHIGSMSVHKGFHLVYAALSQGAFSNLELTVVDHHPRDEAEHQVWGSTPVRIVGKTPQLSIGELYADLDVLLAPSIWPESFGLVAREALASGLWVVASDLGAMGEDVQPGVNGFVIDVSSVSGLRDALTEIDRNPERYLQSPKTVPNLRTSDQQADDLARIYRTILPKTAERSQALEQA